MRHIVALQGLPASGKSTWARQQLASEPTRWKRINRDDFRSMMDGGVYSRKNEDFIRKVSDEIVTAAIKSGYDVILDNTHLVPRTVQAIHELAQKIGNITLTIKPFNLPLEECVERNALRQGSAQVPEKVIRDMARLSSIDRGRIFDETVTVYDTKIVNDHAELMQQNESLPKVIICDLDGTAALFAHHRGPYDATNCDKDLPNKPVIACVHAMIANGYEIIFMSGREEKYREPSEKFIKNYCQLKSSVFRQDVKLFMRPTGDQRPDQIVKRELFEKNVANKYFVEFVLDDRNKVVQHCWRAMGLCCFQVAEGSF